LWSGRMRGWVFQGYGDKLLFDMGLGVEGGN
jgi:hypothetical protein